MFSAITNSFKFVVYFLITAFIVFMTLGINLTVRLDLTGRPIGEIVDYLLDMENLKKIFYDPRTNGAVEHLGEEMGKALDNIQNKAAEFQQSTFGEQEKPRTENW